MTVDDLIRELSELPAIDRTLAIVDRRDRELDQVQVDRTLCVVRLRQ